GTYRWHQHSAAPARRNRPDGDLRHRAHPRAQDLRGDWHPLLQEGEGPVGRRSGEDPRPDRQVHDRGRPAPRDHDEHQAFDGHRLLPRLPSPPRPAAARPAHPHQRAHPQGAAQGRPGAQEI
ncbi:MAG: SSU ribosomal protein S13p (S18e), partial [uncultured Ramlibacter sp.]